MLERTGAKCSRNCHPGPKVINFMLNNPPQLQVKLSCGPENRIIDVSEYEKCVYSISVETPALCADGRQQPTHDEL